MGLRLTNNAESSLLFALASGATALQLAVGQGALFPTLAATDWHPLTLIRKADGQGEIVHVTSRSGDILQISRAREGTSALDFAIGDVVSLRFTAAAYESLAVSGVEDFSVLHGINYGVAAGTGNAILVDVDNVSEYVEGLSIRVHATANNTGSAQINVNSLGSVPIKLSDGSNLPADALQDNSVADLSYSVALAAFVVNNPSIAYSPVAASTTVAGVAQRSSAVAHDIDGDDAAFSTQKTVSRIVADYHATDPSFFDGQWRNLGNGGGGDLTIGSGSNAAFACGLDYQYNNFTLETGGTLSGSTAGVVVIRAKGKITLKGEINVPKAMAQFDDYDKVQAHGPFFGPMGNRPSNSATTLLAQSRPWGESQMMSQLSRREFEAAITSGAPLYMFHGGHGVSTRSDVGVFQAPGGMIFIANEIEITAAARVDGMEHSDPTADVGASGGGMFILCAKTITAGDANTIFSNNPDMVNGTIAPGVGGDGGNGQFFTVNLSTGVVDYVL